MITTMGRRGIHRSSRLIAVAAAVYLTGVATRGARASAPACFAERTVFESVALRDDRFVAFGGLRQGQEVHVRDEPGADGGKWSAVEIARPIAVTGLAERHKLVVFARVEIEAQPGLAWLLAGAPLAIVSGDQERARVVVARPEGEKPQLPAVDVPCTLLRGTAPPEIVGWDFEGPLHRDRAARIAGPPVDWKGERQLESEAGARSVPLYGRAELIDGRRRASILVSAAGDRALIVIVDRYEWTRHRGWTPRAGLDTRRPRKSPDVMCGCLEGASWLTVTYPP
jgi:hypothetical protein